MTWKEYVERLPRHVVWRTILLLIAIFWGGIGIIALRAVARSHHAPACVDIGRAMDLGCGERR